MKLKPTENYSCEYHSSDFNHTHVCKQACQQLYETSNKTSYMFSNENNVELFLSSSFVLKKILESLQNYAIISFYQT